MRFWNILLLWLTVTVISLFSYHHSLKEARSHDFALHQALYQEFYQIKKMPAYAALSQSVFYAKRFQSEKDDHLKSDILSARALNLCDEALQAKRALRWKISALTWVTLLLVLIGGLAWIRYLVKWLLGFFSSSAAENSKSHKFLALSAALILMLILSRWMTAVISAPGMKKYQYEPTMTAAVKMNDYHQLIFEGWAELANQMYLFYSQDQNEQGKHSALDQITDASAQFSKHLTALAPVQSEWLGFDSEPLVRASLEQLQKFRQKVSLLKEWVLAPNEISNERVSTEWLEFSAGFKTYLSTMAGLKRSVNFESLSDYFGEELQDAYFRASRKKEKHEVALIMPGLELFEFASRAGESV